MLVGNVKFFIPNGGNKPCYQILNISHEVASGHGYGEDSKEIVAKTLHSFYESLATDLRAIDYEVIIH